MHRIFKYELEITDLAAVSMPAGAKLLCVQMQHGVPQIWALVDERRPAVARRFRVVGTGHPLAATDLVFSSAYVGSVQTHGGALIFHVFDYGEDVE